MDQFTRQASGFAAARAVNDAGALGLLLEVAGAGAGDRMLDVACGPGAVVCAFAPHVREAVGIDVTPAMITQARVRAEQHGLTNVAWHVGHACPLPWPDDSFDIVTCRYAFHHLRDPGGTLREMVRVCAPGGRVVVADVAASATPAVAARFNRMERLRDPSHVEALPAERLGSLFSDNGLEPIERSCWFRTDLDGLVLNSFPDTEADGREFRDLIVDSIDGDQLGMRLTRQEERVLVDYPIVVLAATC